MGGPLGGFIRAGPLGILMNSGGNVNMTQVLAVAKQILEMVELSQRNQKRESRNGREDFS